MVLSAGVMVKVMFLLYSVLSATASPSAPLYLIWAFTGLSKVRFTVVSLDVSKVSSYWSKAEVKLFSARVKVYSGSSSTGSIYTYNRLTASLPHRSTICAFQASVCGTTVFVRLVLETLPSSLVHPGL